MLWYYILIFLRVYLYYTTYNLSVKCLQMLENSL